MASASASVLSGMWSGMARRRKLQTSTRPRSRGEWRPLACQSAAARLRAARSMRGECPRLIESKMCPAILLSRLLLLFVPALRLSPDNRHRQRHRDRTRSGGVVARRHGHRHQRRDRACRARPSPAPKAATSLAGLPPGDVRTARRDRGLQAARAARARRWPWPTTVVVNITLQVGGARRRVDVVDRPPRRQHVELRAELPGRRRTRSRRCRSTAATTPTSRCCSRACSPTRIATAARSSPTGSA